MLRSIFLHELRYWLRSPLFYFFSLVFFGLALLMLLGTAGYFDGPPAKEESISLLNSPFSIAFISQFFNKFLLFTIPVVIGMALYRDYQQKIFAILYTYPISKIAYLGGKGLSGLVLVLLISLSVGLGLGLGEWIAGTENPSIGPFNAQAYLAAYGLYFIPNMLIVGAIVFAITGLSRNLYAGFIVLIIFFLFQIAIDNAFVGNGFLIGLLDPFGQRAFQWATRDWGELQRNSAAIPLAPVIWYNRLLWCTVAASFLGYFFRQFDFQHDAPWKNLSLFYRSPKAENQPPASVDWHAVRAVRQNFYWTGSAKATLYLAKYDFLSLVKNWMFVALAGFGILTIFFIELRVTNTGEFNLLPTTRILLGGPLHIYSLLIVIATFLYAGLLLHRARTSHMDALIDVTPIRNGQLLGSKIMALVGFQITMLTLFLICGIGIQVYNGYYHFELGSYLYHMAVIVFPMLLVWNITAVFVHTFIRNLFAGLFILLLMWLGADAFEQVGISTSLLKYNKVAEVSYSDFQGYGHQLPGFFLHTGYWLCVAGILSLLSYLLWPRGLMEGLRQRVNQAVGRLQVAIAGLFVLFILPMLFLAFTIYQAERVDDKLLAFSGSKKAVMASFESSFGGVRHLTPPSIQDVLLDIDLYPQQRSFEIKGKYVLVNRTDKAIYTILVRTGFDEQTHLRWNRPHVVLIKDTILKCTVFRLEKSLLPGDSLFLSFSIQNLPNTVYTRYSNVLENGTFLKHDVLPRLGYMFDEHPPKADDPDAGQFHYFGKDADQVSLKTTLSVPGNQIAIAPGNLVKQETRDGRKHYTYQTPVPIKFNFSFHAGNYDCRKDSLNGLQLEVWHHPNHTQNVAAMMAGLKAALQYNATWFKAYPYDKIRIVEFPHTEDAFTATLTANNIPTSEILFNLNTRAMQDKINLPFYVMAHELTHEWFGNQVMPADAQGAKMLTESITEYLTLMIYKTTFGDEAAEKFLDVQKRRYQQGRAKERGTEQALANVESHQEYIAYGKGTIAFNTLATRMGENQLNAILATYAEQYGGRPTRYPTTRDFLHLLEEQSPKKHHGLIRQLFYATGPVPATDGG